MKKDNEQLKINLYYIAVAMIYLLCIHGLILINSRVSNEDDVAFFRELVMMIFSGLFSASVAYIVSSIRVIQERKKQTEKDIQQNIRIKNLLLLEIRSNKESLEKLHKLGFSEKNKKVLETQLSFVIYNRYIDKINLNDEAMILLIKMFKNITFYTTLDPLDMEAGYARLLSVLNEVIIELEKE